MTSKFLIADRLVQIDGWVPIDLFGGFACDSEDTSAPDSCNQEPICSISLPVGERVHGVETLTPACSVHHVLSLQRDPSAFLLANGDFSEIALRSMRPESVLANTRTVVGYRC